MKTPQESETIMTEVVCPNDTNPMGLLQGGRLVQWMDIAAAVCAQRHADQICVTSHINAMRFRSSAKVGDVLTINAKLTRAFTTSMEILVQAWSKRLHVKNPVLINDAYFSFVAVNSEGTPQRVPMVKPQSQIEQSEFEDALLRRQTILSTGKNS